MSFPLSNLGIDLTILDIENQLKSIYNLAIKCECQTIVFVNVSYLNVKRGMGNDRKHQARNL